MKKILKWSFLSLVFFVILTMVIVIAWMNLSPQFGGTVSKAQKEAYAKTGHYARGIFLNDEEINMEMDCHSITAMFREVMNPHPDVTPGQNIEVQRISQQNINTLPDTVARISWLGHSSFLIELDGMKILIDPVFGQYASPHPWFGRKRFNSEMPISIHELPDIDIVIISHDHYDHLDYPSIKQLKEKVGHFFVPLGVGNHLKRWKISDDMISELDWWQEQEFSELKIIMTPSRHMSGRGFTDQSATLWGSWIIQGAGRNIYFSGDGGYGKHFKSIGEKYGPFDIGLMECGQYNELWRDVHLMPEESVQAAIDVKADLIIPIHWGSFALATHSWTDPVERITKEAARLSVPITTPRIGEPVYLNGSLLPPKGRWWDPVNQSSLTQGYIN